MKSASFAKVTDKARRNTTASNSFWLFLDSPNKKIHNYLFELIFLLTSEQESNEIAGKQKWRPMREGQ